MPQNPLADRMRPKNFDEIAGQTHLVGEKGILRKLVNNNRIPNMIFYGPPGIVKTTVANIIAEMSGMQLFKLNATTASLSDIKDVISSTENIFSDSLSRRSRKGMRMPALPMRIRGLRKPEMM